MDQLQNSTIRAQQELARRLKRTKEKAKEHEEQPAEVLTPQSEAKVEISCVDSGENSSDAPKNKIKWCNLQKQRCHSREQHKASEMRDGIKFSRWLSTRLSAKSNCDLRVNNAPNELKRLPMSPMLIDLRAEEII